MTPKIYQIRSSFGRQLDAEFLDYYTLLSQLPTTPFVASFRVCELPGADVHQASSGRHAEGHFLRKTKRALSGLDYFRFYIPSLDLDERRGSVEAF